MQREKKPKNFLPKPIYKGGPKAMAIFISKHLTYPKKAKAEKIEGTVVLRVAINFKGKVTGSKVRSSLGYGCDKEAQRLVSLLKFEVSSTVRKGKILFHKTINIHFKLPKEEIKKVESAGQTQLSYSIVKTTTKKKPSSYNYTVRF